MCGLTGVVSSSKNKHTFPIAEAKLLGIFTRSRGKHSVGFMVDGMVHKGVYEAYNRDYGDPLEFFSDLYFNLGNILKNRVMIIHNRFATRGAKTTENAHPFKYVVNGVNHYFAHNGTIENVEELCTKYNLDPKDFQVDSQLLGYIIVNFGFEVLREYIGAAAFLYYREDRPDVLYVWKGNSKCESIHPEDERPLFYAITSKGFFINSEATNLQCALDLTKDLVLDFPANSVIEVSARGFTIVEEIDRSQIEKKKLPPAQHVDVGFRRTHHSDSGEWNIFRNTNKKKDKYLHTAKNPECQEVPNKKRVYMHHGRYFSNGRPIEGFKAIGPDGIEVDFSMESFGDNTESLIFSYFYKGMPMSSREAAEGLKDVADAQMCYAIEKARDLKVPFFFFSVGGNLYYYPKEAPMIATGKKLFRVGLAKPKKYCLDVSKNQYYVLPADTTEEQIPNIVVEDKTDLAYCTAPFHHRALMTQASKTNTNGQSTLDAGWAGFGL